MWSRRCLTSALGPPTARGRGHPPGVGGVSVRSHGVEPSLLPVGDPLALGLYGRCRSERLSALSKKVWLPRPRGSSSCVAINPDEPSDGCREETTSLDEHALQFDIFNVWVPGWRSAGAVLRLLRYEQPLSLRPLEGTAGPGNQDHVRADDLRHLGDRSAAAFAWTTASVRIREVGCTGLPIVDPFACRTFPPAAGETHGPCSTSVPTSSRLPADGSCTCSCA